MIDHEKTADVIRALQAEVHATCREKGFWDSPRNTGEMLALAHSELSEALEVYRGGHSLTAVWLSHNDTKPEGFGPELADCVLRILDMAGGLGINLGECLLAKHDYNRGRERLHGKRF